ncbi:ANTAR domain-containing protein [Actinophytocola sp. NPDC049390]|uniref:ANTAR domain-containing protein n=1 Tax=Actinophytocola sp. NPDC049390 TaxID=3363894 RepID=UPI0037AE2989
MNERSRRLVDLTEILVSGLDEPAQRQRLTVMCAELLDVQAAALLALDLDGAPAMAGASEETAELLTRFELAYEQGPGIDVLRTGARVECADLSAARLRWPRFAPVALDAGVAAAVGLPCVLCDDVVGALTLYTATPGHVAADDDVVSRGLVNTMSLGVTAHRSRELAARATQLQGALDTRVVIEQAKGMLAERESITVDEAFTLLRNHSRGTGTKLREVAQDVVKGVLRLPRQK